MSISILIYPQAISILYGNVSGSPTPAGHQCNDHAGFDVSERFSIRPRSFDLIARNNGTLLVIKVVSHIDSISEEVAFDLEVISRHLGGSLW